MSTVVMWEYRGSVSQVSQLIERHQRYSNQLDVTK